MIDRFIESVDGDLPPLDSGLRKALNETCL